MRGARRGKLAGAKRLVGGAHSRTRACLHVDAAKVRKSSGHPVDLERYGACGRLRDPRHSYCERCVRGLGREGLHSLWRKGAKSRKSSSLSHCEFSRGILTRKPLRQALGAGQGCPQSMGAAESAEAAAQGGLTTEILKLKAAKANGWLSDDEFDAEVHPPPLFEARGLACEPARTNGARALITHIIPTPLCIPGQEAHSGVQW